MKKIVFTAVSALALAAFADGVNSTEFGVLTVSSSAAETLVSVPWLESGTTNANVKICDLVLTAGLKTAESPYGADLVQYHNGSNWQVWALQEKEGVKSWVAQSGGATAETTLARGRALLLKRENPGRASKFYIMGKPATISAEPTPLLTASGSSPAYTLIAPPTTTGATVGSLNFSGLTKFKDSLIIGDSFTILTWTGTKWVDESGADAGSTPIPAGQGIWFVSGVGSSGTKTVTW